jgi:hypothetical protein
MRNTLVIFVTCIALIGCANSRRITVEKRSLDLSSDTLFYVNLNEEYERVTYGTGLNPLDFEKYAGGRKKGSAKMDVPLEIANCLHRNGKSVVLGGGKNYPAGDTVIIRYEELWGWDMGDIIKSLNIKAFKSENPEALVSVDFTEMTIFNSHPTAKNLVPKMIDSLLSIKK